jgi:hypothetical protein
MLCNGVVLYHCRFSCLYLRLIAYSWRASALRAQLGFAELKSQFAPLPWYDSPFWLSYHGSGPF